MPKVENPGHTGLNGSQIKGIDIKQKALGGLFCILQICYFLLSV